MDMVTRVRAALLAALCKGESGLGGVGTAYVLDVSSDGDDEVVVDGYIDLSALARSAIAAMREPTEGMVNAGWKHSSARTAWQGMIDAALTSSEPQAPSSE